MESATEDLTGEAAFDAACAPDAPQFISELSTDAVAVLAIARNRNDLALAEACTPADGDDVSEFIDRLRAGTGCSRGLVRTYADIGTTLLRLPRLATVLRHRNHLPLEHLRALARATACLEDEFLAEYETCVLSLVVADVDRQVLVGWRSFYESLQRIIEMLSPRVRPRNIDPEPIPDGCAPEETIHTESSNDTTYVTAVLDKIRAFEIFSGLDAIAARHNCDRVEALTHLIRGNLDVQVTLNLYLPLGGTTAWEPTLGMLDWIATGEFLKKVSSIRVLRDGVTDAYRPTDAQRAFVIARDGTCRFPGCDVPASRCQLDHIREYDKKNPAEGGPTDTENLHCLCTRHHQMKTFGMWSVSRNTDSTEVWRSTKTDTECVTVPNGPAARIGRITFAEELKRSTTVLREFNDRRIARMKEEAIELDFAMRVFEADRDRLDAQFEADRDGYGLSWSRSLPMYPDDATMQSPDPVVIEVPLPWPLDPVKIRQAEKEAGEAAANPSEEKIPF